MDTQYIVGKLTPTNPDAITNRTYKHIYNAITGSNLYGIVFSEDWEDGILTLNNHTPNVTPEECPSPLEFITRITKLLKSNGIAALSLEGEITVIVPDIEPTVFKLLVRDGKLYHLTSEITWAEKAYSLY